MVRLLTPENIEEIGRNFDDGLNSLTCEWTFRDDLIISYLHEYKSYEYNIW